MTLHQAFRFALDPTTGRRRALASHCGAARFAFNWGLHEVKATLDARRTESQILGGPVTESMSWSLPALRREWNRQKHSAAPWWSEVSKEAFSSGLDGLAHALKAWSARRTGERAGGPVGFPRFRKRGHRDRCRFTTGAIRVDDERHITLPRIGRVRTAEATTALGCRVADGSARILSATISREADRWFVSFTCEVERPVVASNGQSDTVGVDLGVARLATLSDGELVLGPRALRAALRRMRRLQRAVSRRQRGSARRRRAVGRLARAHRRVAGVRRHHLHVLTTTLAKRHGCVVIEDLNVRGMSRSAGGTVEEPGRNVGAKAGLNRGIADGSFGELRRMLTYKCEWYGARLVVADRYFPSSKRCSGCASVRISLRRSERVYRCASCGLVIDRDLNAARNLVWWAQAHDGTASAAGTGGGDVPNARGEDERSGMSGDILVEAGTGHDPEPSSPTGGHHWLGLPFVPQ